MKSEHTGRRTASELEESVSQHAQSSAATDRRASVLCTGRRATAETGCSSDWRRRHTQEIEDDRWDVQLESTGGVCLLIT